MTPITYRSFIFAALATGILCVSSGCGPEGPEIGSVTGVVTLDGKPLPDARVTFQPTFEGGPSHGTTGPDGRYELHYRSGRMGALIGEHEVSVSTYQMISETDGGGEIPELVPPKYNENTELVKTVEPGHNEIDLPLTSN